MPIVTRTSIVNKNRKRLVRKVMVPEWGNGSFCYVRTLRASEIDDVQKIADSTKDNTGTADSLVQWCIMGACDAKGKRIFKSSDKQSLLDGPLIPVQTIVTAFMKYNGITEDDEAKN